MQYVPMTRTQSYRCRADTPMMNEPATEIFRTWRKKRRNPLDDASRSSSGISVDSENVTSTISRPFLLPVPLRQLPVVMVYYSEYQLGDIYCSEAATPINTGGTEGKKRVDDVLKDVLFNEAEKRQHQRSYHSTLTGSPKASRSSAHSCLDPIYRNRVLIRKGPSKLLYTLRSFYHSLWISRYTSSCVR